MYIRHELNTVPGLIDMYHSIGTISLPDESWTWKTIKTGPTQYKCEYCDYISDKMGECTHCGAPITEDCEV